MDKSQQLKNKVSLTGSCLCGGVSYSINGLVRDVVNCFCSECRKTSGHHVAATRVNKDNIEIKQSTLCWYEHRQGIFRGFCKRCGGNLFWDNGKDNELSIMAGTLDPPTKLTTSENIHIEDASDYCVIPDINTDL